MAAQKEEKRDVVEEPEIKRKAHRWCKDSIGGVWTKVSADEMILEHVSGGMTNYLYLCRLPDRLRPLRDEPHQVLLRIYGHITTSNMDVLVHNSVVFALLAEKRLGPKPYGMFFDGRIEEFILAQPLKHVELSHPEIAQLVAERLATFHSLDMPLCKKPRWMFSIIKRWISEIQNNFSGHSMKGAGGVEGGDSETILRLQAIDMEKECDVLMKIVSKVDSPVVFCHNDLQEGNILYNSSESDPEKKMTIIDWEYGNYNYRGFDLGNHFCEWAIGYDEESFTVEPERYPSRQQQYTFFRHYLKEYGQEDVSAEDLRHMYAEANTFALASHFLWGTWATVQGHSSSINFSFWDYAVSRFEQYFKLKERLPAMLKEDL
ncbi:choline/ethanolamine kinase-like [Littorina saxatilis]|uniref:Choline/ethanolamine kinase n=1 Tax=Littorina saxatilis TaxID=31220 RepID=A0AAN9B5R3_9CAEN